MPKIAIVENCQKCPHWDPKLWKGLWECQMDLHRAHDEEALFAHCPLPDQKPSLEELINEARLERI
jgi:hypothetical protein